MTRKTRIFVTAALLSVPALLLIMIVVSLAIEHVLDERPAIRKALMEKGVYRKVITVGTRKWSEDIEFNGAGCIKWVVPGRDEKQVLRVAYQLRGLLDNHWVYKPTGYGGIIAVSFLSVIGQPVKVHLTWWRKGSRSCTGLPN